MQGKALTMAFALVAGLALATPVSANWRGGGGGHFGGFHGGGFHGGGFHAAGPRFGGHHGGFGGYRGYAHGWGGRRYVGGGYWGGPSYGWYGGYAGPSWSYCNPVAVLLNPWACGL